MARVFLGSGGSFMGPSYGPEPPVQGSDVRALNLYRVHFYRVHKGYIRGTMLRTHLNPKPRGFGFRVQGSGFRV